MAREFRQIGIRTAEVRLPEPASFGPALLKTASGVANRAFEKQADIRTQEAQNAAGLLNFERDGDGNLTAPSLPIGENGLLAPSIYDRAYTQMVSTKYLNQSKIDTKERLNLLATENRFDPQAYKILAEAYVKKVTELSPDILKTDVNQSAQVVMVEHYNQIIRRTAEKDHAEARAVSLTSLNDLGDELVGYVEAGATDAQISAQMLKIRAVIEEGRDVREGGFGFWGEAEAELMLDQVDKRYVLSKLISSITGLPDDPVAHADALQALDDFSAGDGTISMINEFGEHYTADVTEIYPNPDDRAEIVAHSVSVLALKERAFLGVRSARLERDMDTFFNWFSPHALANKDNWDLPRLYEEYDKAHQNVLLHDYDDTLRETIRGLIDQQETGMTGTASQWQKDFDPVYQNWMDRYEAEMAKFFDGRPASDYTDDEVRDFNDATLRRIGNITSDQSASSEREIGRYYNGMTGRDLTQGYWEDMIENRNHPGWSEMQLMVPSRLARVGVWPKEVNDAIKGKLEAPESLSRDTLNNTLELARLFYDQPSFANNMEDANALGTQVGGALRYLFDNNGMLNADNVREQLDNFGRSDYRPYINYDKMPDEVKLEWEAQAKAYLAGAMENNNWMSIGPAKGVEAPRWSEGGWNPLAPQLTGLDSIFQNLVIDKLKKYAGRMNPDNPDSFAPYISRAVNEVLQENGLAPTKIGYNADRYSNYYEAGGWPNQWLRGFTKPTWAVVQRPPEWFVANHPRYNAFSKDGKVNRDVMEFITADFQKVLTAYSKARWPDDETHWKAGENAALIYSGINSASDREAIPSWTIVLIGDNGIDQETLTRGGLFEDDPVLFNLEEGFKAFTAEKKRKDDLDRDRGTRLREYYQSEQYQIDKMLGIR